VQGTRDLPSLGSLQGRRSWTVINTVYTLRYADQHFRSKPGGVAFGTEDGQQQPSYRDCAYVAFTIGMTYQVSDTTLRDPQIRRSVLAHAVLSYVFGVSSSQARSTSSPDCSGNPRQPQRSHRGHADGLAAPSRATCGLTERCAR
jgi:Protein of unknown function (DUF1345)